MAKLKNPFHSLSAHGSIGRTLTVRRRSKDHIAQTYPDHPDANTPAQQGQRLMFTMCKDLWHTLSQAEQRTWESLARPFHMSGYSYYLSQCLRPNPGIYLPLAGGTMQGAVNMDSNRIQTLPAPGAPADPARLAELTAHAALLSGVHGLQGDISFHAYRSVTQSVPTGTHTKVAFNATLFDTNSDFDTVNNRHQPTIAGKYLYLAQCYPSSMPTTRYLYLRFRRNLSNFAYGNRIYASGTSSLYPLAFALANMNGSSHYMELYTYHNSGSNESYYAGTYRTFLYGFLLAQT